MNYKIALLISGVMASTGFAFAQQQVQREEVDHFVIAGPPPGAAGMMMQQALPSGGPPTDFTYQFISSGVFLGGNVVKGAPYSAEAVTESIQTLADGNRITHKNTAKLYRDAEGRTRREETLALIGPWMASGEPPQMVTINDPVAGVNYMLDARTRTARKMTAPIATIKPRLDPAPGATAGTSVEPFNLPVPAPPPGMPGPATWVFSSAERSTQKATETQTESLGQQTISGVRAEGTRTSFTIPAGQIGNDLPIEVTSESWFSQELGMVVMTKRSDPRVGTTTYQLSDIRRDGPAPSLFEVPADYTIQDAPGPMRFEQRLQRGSPTTQPR